MRYLWFLAILASLAPIPSPAVAQDDQQQYAFAKNAASTLTPQGHEALAKVAAAFLAADDRQVAALLASGDVGEVERNGNEQG
jgi:hypothetical protein